MRARSTLLEAFTGGCFAPGARSSRVRTEADIIRTCSLAVVEELAEERWLSSLWR
jgi:hypothetical protein